MAFVVVTDYVSYGTATTSANATLTVGGSFAGAKADVETTLDIQYGIGTPFTHSSSDFKSYEQSDSSAFDLSSLTSDADYRLRARGSNDVDGTKTGGTLTRRSPAMPATASAPTSSSVTSSTATIACNFYPNTLTSIASVWLEYKKTSDTAWTVAGAVTDYSGYAVQAISRDLTGLTELTQYQYRLRMTRTTSTSKTLTSSTSSFETEANAPSVTTSAATGVSAVAANLNALVDPNGFSVVVTFQWDVDSGAPYANETTPGETVTGDTAVTVSKQITGLTFSTPYYYRAKAVYSGGTIYGSEVTFTTAADPAAEAAAEDHMQVWDFNERKYGVASTFYFCFASPAATSSDRFFNAATPLVAGDVQLSKDGGAFANVGTLPARVGTSPWFGLSLTATEMECTTGIVAIVDQDGPAFRDCAISFRTKQELGQILLNATQLGGNNPGMSVTGVGTSPAIALAGGATSVADITGTLSGSIIRRGTATGGGASTITLDILASATADWYNGCIIILTGGTGAYQSRVIVDYAAATFVATVNRGWSTNPANGTTFTIVPGPDVWTVSPGVELAAMPTYASGYGAMTQFLFQRFAYKRTQTALVQTIIKADAATALATGSVADDGTTQTSGALA